MFEKLRFNRATHRLFEEKLFEMALNEYSEGNRKTGLWAMSVVQSDGDENKARSVYLKLRVQSLKDEILISVTVDEWLKSLDVKGCPESRYDPKLNAEFVCVVCDQCGLFEDINIEGIRNTSNYEYFTSKKIPFYNVKSLKCKQCGHKNKIDFWGAKSK
jgi:hypothetical protein